MLAIEFIFVLEMCSLTKLFQLNPYLIAFLQILSSHTPFDREECSTKKTVCGPWVGIGLSNYYSQHNFWLLIIRMFVATHEQCQHGMSCLGKGHSVLAGWAVQCIGEPQHNSLYKPWDDIMRLMWAAVFMSEAPCYGTRERGMWGDCVYIHTECMVLWCVRLG